MLNTRSLKTYIRSKGVAFQPINCLFEVSNEEAARVKNFISSQITNDNWEVLTREQAFELGFEDLASWAMLSDYIIAIELKEPIHDEYYVSICIPQNDYEPIKC